jgi:hypothetical protein
MLAEWEPCEGGHPWWCEACEEWHDCTDETHSGRTLVSWVLDQLTGYRFNTGGPPAA